MKSIAFLGRTNAGKSTLINCLVNNQIAAISDKVHTTRIPLQGILHLDKEK
ncbi:MAG: 50S ribosome-binding GTPase [Mollicutes bacterium]|nr:MAG: 50S ribosome-binding GTPase [Mollicutes bacterium]